MKYIIEENNNTYEEKKSKFIAYLMPYDKFNENMKILKSEHTKARHFVYAYRYLNEFDQIVENSSDDGEPRGTSGKPSLNVLNGNELINTAVIIIRYFGGVKLGTGGLVRAYSDAVNQVLEKTVIFEYEKLDKKFLRIPYAFLQKCEYLCKQHNVKIVSRKFDNDVILNLEGTIDNFKLFNALLPISLKIN